MGEDEVAALQVVCQFESAQFAQRSIPWNSNLMLFDNLYSSFLEGALVREGMMEPMAAR